MQLSTLFMLFAAGGASAYPSSDRLIDSNALMSASLWTRAPGGAHGFFNRKRQTQAVPDASTSQDQTAGSMPMGANPLSGGSASGTPTDLNPGTNTAVSNGQSSTAIAVAGPGQSVQETAGGGAGNQALGNQATGNQATGNQATGGQATGTGNGGAVYIDTVNSYRQKFNLSKYQWNSELEQNAIYQGQQTQGIPDSAHELEDPCPGSAQIEAAGDSGSSIDLAMLIWLCEVPTPNIPAANCSQANSYAHEVWTERGHFDQLVGTDQADWSQIGCAFTQMQGHDPLITATLTGLWTCTLGNQGYTNCKGSAGGSSSNPGAAGTPGTAGTPGAANNMANSGGATPVQTS